MRLCLVLTFNQLLICLTCARRSSSPLSMIQIYTSTNSHHFWYNFHIFTMGKKRRVEAEQKTPRTTWKALEGVNWSPKTFLLVKARLKSLDLRLMFLFSMPNWWTKSENPVDIGNHYIAELNWGGLNIPTASTITGFCRGNPVRGSWFWPSSIERIHCISSKELQLNTVPNNNRCLPSLLDNTFKNPMNHS